MPPGLIDFARAERTAVLAVKMPDGSPHAATLHYAHLEDPLTFIFLTHPTSRKFEALTNGDTPASLVIGTTEKEMRTLQLDGVAKLEDSPALRAAYDAKFPEKSEKFNEDIFFTFKPVWWRFTDWTSPEGKTIYTSDSGVIVRPK